MERRELLKGGLALGATLVADPQPRSADAAAGNVPPVAFFEGKLEGRHFRNWEFSFSVTGSRCQGFAFDPATAGGELQALRFEGRVRLSHLSMQVYALEDVNHLRPLGELVATGDRGVVQGRFVLPARG